MPRFIIQRNFGPIDEEEMRQVGEDSHRIIAEQVTDVVWEVSHVAANEAGDITTFCIYQAPNEDRIREHAQLLGRHVIYALYEIGGDVSPSDFPI
jgi:Nickel responsive protein SCO4226-like